MDSLNSLHSCDASSSSHHSWVFSACRAFRLPPTRPSAATSTAPHPMELNAKDNQAPGSSSSTSIMDTSLCAASRSRSSRKACAGSPDAAPASASTTRPPTRGSDVSTSRSRRSSGTSSTMPVAIGPASPLMANSYSLPPVGGTRATTAAFSKSTPGMASFSSGSRWAPPLTTASPVSMGSTCFSARKPS